MNEASFEIEQVKLTQDHIRLVGGYLQKCVLALFNRSRFHDASKFSKEEWPGFLVATQNLKNCTYGSDEYKAFLEQLKPTLDHHYASNRHHAEHYDDSSLASMTLLDLIEMLCDWLAATARHNDGDIYKSIEINQSRFGYSDEIKSILTNTVNELVGGEKMKPLKQAEKEFKL